MLHPVYRLAISAGNAPALKPLGTKSWQRRLLVPRSMCVFESLPCAGLAWHEYRSFARMQASRLSPWLNTGASAAIRGGRLMLWLWDQQELDALLAQCGEDPAPQRRPLVETLYRPLSWESGEVEFAGDGGVEQLRIENGAIVASQWQPDAGTSDGPWRKTPWAFELLGSKQADRSQPGYPQIGVGARRAAPLVVTAAAAAYALFHLGSYLGLDHRLEVLEQEAELADQRISSLSAAGQELKKESEWLASYRRLAASVDLQAVLNVLQPVLERHGVVLKEFELRGDQLRIAVITAGGDIDLPELLRSLSRLAGVSDVQLRDNTELRQASFSLQMTGLRRLLGPGG